MYSGDYNNLNRATLVFFCFEIILSFKNVTMQQNIQKLQIARKAQTKQTQRRIRW